MLAKQDSRSFSRLMNEVKRVRVPVANNVFGVLRANLVKLKAFN